MSYAYTSGPILNIELRHWYTLIALLCGAVFLLVLWELLAGSGPVLWFMEQYLSDDGQIELPLKRYLQALMISAWLIALLFYCRFRYPQLNKLPAPEPTWFYLLLVPMCLIFMANRHGLIELSPLFYEEDGLMETLTVIGMLIACGWLSVTALHTQRNGGESGFVVGSALVAAALFFLAMEEISWGQRIFGISSPEFFNRYNDQQEINLHNFDNRLVWIAYQVFATILASLMVVGQEPQVQGWLRRLLPGLERLIPNKNMLYIAVLFVLIAHYNELFEEVFALFALVYGRLMYRRAKETA